MKKKFLAVLMAATVAAGTLAGCGESAPAQETMDMPTTEAAPTEAPTEEAEPTESEAEVVEETEELSDEEKAAAVAELIDAIYVQQRTDETDEQCAAAKAAWDALTDAQKELVEGENADPDYFGRDTGDASLSSELI